MKQIRILLVDDHEIVRAGLRALLDAASAISVVGEAADGAEACRLARDLSPDVVVMDVSMPVLSGTDATRRLREECPGARVIALTMHEDRAHLTRLLKVGASGYVLKRAVADELVRAIEVVAGGGTYVDPLLAGDVLRSSAAPSEESAASETLSDREEEVLRLIAWGMSNKKIGAELGISTKTVETYKARISKKLGLRSRTEMVRFALEQGWLADG